MSHNVQQSSSSICHTWVIISTFSFHGSAISSTSTTDEKICRPTKKGVSSSLIKQHFSSLNHKQSKGKGREVRIFKDPILLRTFWMHNELWIEWIFLKMEEYFVTIFCVTIDDACKVSSMDYKDIGNIVKRTYKNTFLWPFAFFAGCCEDAMHIMSADKTVRNDGQAQALLQLCVLVPASWGLAWKT